jgi:hypothetical protein
LLNLMWTLARRTHGISKRRGAEKRKVRVS